MNAKDAIRIALQGTHAMLNSYLSDLTDADLLVRPVPNANHIAWQLGHLISAEVGLLCPVVPGLISVPLPPGFKEQHDNSTAAVDPPKGFLKKAEYLNLFNQARESTIAAVNKLNDADLDKPTTGSMAKFAPTLGALLLLQSHHVLMHAGQVTVVRRKLGKPVLF
jgi:DinB superfamily